MQQRLLTILVVSCWSLNFAAVAVAQVGVTVPVVVDSTGQIVGSLLNAHTDATVLLDTVAGPVVLQVDTNSLSWGGALFFASPGCAGTPYLYQQVVGSLVRRAVTVAASPEDTHPGHALYVPAGDDIVMLSPQSYRYFQSCDPISDTPIPVTAALLVGDLFEMFPPPYRLDVRAVSTGPDLTISALATVPTTPSSAGATTIKVTSKNAGAETVGASTTRIYLSLDGVVSPDDEILAEISVPALPPQGSRTNTVSVPLPQGSRYLIAVADADDAQPESKENNNIRKVLKNVS